MHTFRFEFKFVCIATGIVDVDGCTIACAMYVIANYLKWICSERLLKCKTWSKLQVDDYQQELVSGYCRSLVTLRASDSLRLQTTWLGRKSPISPSPSILQNPYLEHFYRQYVWGIQVTHLDFTGTLQPLSVLLFRSDRALHTHPCNETTGGPSAEVELPSLRRVPAGLPVPHRHWQVLCGVHGSPVRHGHPRAAPRQRPFKDGPPRQKSQEGSGEVSHKGTLVCDIVYKWGCYPTLSIFI